MMRMVIAEDAPNSRWLALQLNHHLIGENTSARLLDAEVKSHLLGLSHLLPEPVPFRNFVAQARLGVSQQAHEAFFGELLGDVDECTAPFGMTDVRGDGSELSTFRGPRCWRVCPGRTTWCLAR
jgi:hypothetical protein